MRISSSLVYQIKRKLNFYVAENIFINVDIEELNDVYGTSGHIKVDEDDDINEHQFNEDDYNGHDDDDDDDDEIKKEEEDNFDKIIKHQYVMKLTLM